MSLQVVWVYILSDELSWGLSVLSTESVVYHTCKKPAVDESIDSRNSLGPEVIKKNFILNSAQHEIYPAHKC